MITFQVDPWSKFKPELKELSSAHWGEIALSKDKIKLNVDWGKYDELDSLGMLVCVTVRDEELIVGYHIIFTVENPHYVGYKLAQTDVYYVRPQYRVGITGIRLFQFSEKVCRDLGCVKMITSTKIHRNVSPMFQYLGWTHVENVFTRDLI